jgi:hypothetical protein
MTPHDGDRFRPADGIISRRLGEDMVVVHLGTNRIYELNVTAARLWEILTDGVTAAEACDRLASEFDTEPATVVDDVQRTLDHFTAEGLVVPVHD